MRILAIDYGKKRIGIAISDPLKILASPLKTIIALDNHKATVARLIQEIKELSECEKILIGLPLHMNGKESEMSQEVRAFGSLLQEETNKEVAFFLVDSFCFNCFLSYMAAVSDFSCRTICCCFYSSFKK